jgi:hypothetical protein
MSVKEFINTQFDKYTSPLTKEQFTELTETENSLLILEIPQKDYSLTEVARIVESNNAHVLSLSTLPISGGADILLSLKLDLHDLTAVLRSFERFNYKVVYFYMREGEVTDTQKERYDELMYYLEM